MTMTILCPLCRGPLKQAASIEKPTTIEVRGRCEGCKAHVVALVTAEQFESQESQAGTWKCDSCPGAQFTYDKAREHARAHENHLMSRVSNHSIDGEPCYGCDLCVTATGSHSVV